MKKETICIFIILILCAGLYLIYYFMNPNAFLVNNNTTTTISMENYYIKDSNNYYASYGINNISSKLEIDLNNVSFNYNNMAISINNNKIIDNVTLLSDFAKYGNNLVLIYKYNDSYKEGIIIYDINNNKYNIIDELDNLYIKEISNISSNSLNIIVSNVDGNKIYVNNTEDICNAMISDDYIVNENIIYNYDNSNNNFSYEVISSMTKGSYVAINNLC